MAARGDSALLARPRQNENPLDADDFEKLFRRFAHMVTQAGVLREVRLRSHFEPASVKCQRKHLDEVRRRRQ